MARHRMLRKEIWKNPAFTNLPPLTRLFYLGLHNFADDEGKLLYDPVKLKRNILPHEYDFNTRAATEALDAANLILRYVVRGDEYIRILGFEETQVINRKTVSTLPNPEPESSSQ